jgi:hypothetical protein
MSDYRVTCTVKGTHRNWTGTATHGHIISVGIGNDQGWSQVLSVAEVEAAIANRHRFYTVSPSTGKTPLIEPVTCCGIPTLRTVGDQVLDNNLDRLPNCVRR